MVGALYAPPKTLRKSVLTGVANMPPAALAFLTMSALTSFFNWSLFLATVPVKSLRAVRVASRLLSSLAGSATVRTADRWNFTAWPSGSRKVRRRGRWAACCFGQGLYRAGRASPPECER